MVYSVLMLNQVDVLNQEAKVSSKRGSKAYWTVSELAEALEVTPAAVYNSIYRNQIHAEKVPVGVTGEEWRIPSDEAERLIGRKKRAQ